MNRLVQTISGAPHGDCFRTCIASILGLDSPTRLPNFVEWWEEDKTGEKVDDYLADHFGLVIDWSPVDEIWTADAWGARGYWIATVPSLNIEPTEQEPCPWHVVVMIGKDLAHDPAIGRRYKMVSFQDVHYVRTIRLVNPDALRAAWSFDSR